MTDYEMVMLRLRAWKALDGWGVAGDPKATDIIDKPWGWEERKRRADELVAWVMGKDEKAPAGLMSDRMPT